MRNFIPAFCVVAVAAFCSVPALAFREPKTISATGGGGAGIIGLIIVLALIVGVSMMSPRRTHQD